MPNEQRAIYTEDAFSLRTGEAEKFLEDIVAAIQISESRYEEAVSRYKSIAEWLGRDNSGLKAVNPKVSLQGSFRLRTVIKPLSNEEDYDIDLVCTVDYTKFQISQAELKEAFKKELLKYTQQYGMAEPQPKRRCWRINYSNDVKFHLDALPAIPEENNRRLLLESLGVSPELAAESIAITDTDHPSYNIRSNNWPLSNPKGYADWFMLRMKQIYNARRQAIALDEAISVEEVPEYRVRTPLQHAIQILKRHRDMTHEGEIDNRPISIIISTLAAQAYHGEGNISSALYSILSKMDRFIEVKNGIYWVPNPTNPNENFADKWQDEPAKRDSFYDWLDKAKKDFIALASLTDRDVMTETMSPVFGNELVEKANKINRPNFLKRLLNPSHRAPLAWEYNGNGKAEIIATCRRDGFRNYPIKSDSQALPRNCNLSFEAKTNVPEPYDVHWQVVNTGNQARTAKGLRGGFDISNKGNNIRTESTSYRGSHSMECFIVKNGYCVARSGQFVVNIQ